MGDSWEKVPWAKQFFHGVHEDVKRAFQSPYALAASKAVIPLRGWEGNIMEMQLHAVIAHGGQGTVFRASHISTSSPSESIFLCAKATPWRPGSIAEDLSRVESQVVGRLAQRFQAAGKGATSLQKDLIAHTFLPFARGCWNNYVWTAMSMGTQNLESFWLEKKKQERFIKAATPAQRIDAAMALGEEIACGFDIVHKLGYSNNDAKPANAMITKEHYVAIGDMGIAIDLEALYDIQGHLGTKNWAAPEIRPRPHANSDSFGVAAIVICFATGLSPSHRFDAAADSLEATTPFSTKYVASVFHAFGDEIAQFLLRALYTDPDARPSVVEQLEFFRKQRKSRKSHVTQVDDLVGATDALHFGVSSGSTADLTSFLADNASCQPSEERICSQCVQHKAQKPPQMNPSALKKSAQPTTLPTPPGAQIMKPLSMSAEQLDAFVLEIFAQKDREEAFKDANLLAPLDRTWINISEAVIPDFDGEKFALGAAKSEAQKLRDQLVFQHVRFFLLNKVAASGQKLDQPKAILSNPKFYEEYLGIICFFVWCVTGPKQHVCKVLAQAPSQPDRHPTDIVNRCPGGAPKYPTGWMNILNSKRRLLILSRYLASAP
eukprot:TRINITY_DN131_c0_g2_i2.p1 TRINITY_DN131_c0_g2~~TRINITY_DN131_c0_g2_i2.p1  ORF type:complete len:605 (-),score=114.49 TRINITY_DN131_c0_g2_i2:545-2359(-)